MSEIANAVGADVVLVSGKDQAGLFFTVHAAIPPPLDINYSFPLADLLARSPCSRVKPGSAIALPAVPRRRAGALRGESLCRRRAQERRWERPSACCSVIVKPAMPRMEKKMGLLRLLARSPVVNWR